MVNPKQELSVKLTADSSDLVKGTADASKSLENLSQDIKNVDAQSIEVTADVDLERVNRDIATLDKVLDNIEKQKAEADVGLDLTTLVKDEAKVHKAMDILEKRKLDIESTISADTSDLGTADIDNVAFSTAAMTAGFGEFAEEFGNITDAVGGLGVALGGLGLVKLAADVETTKLQLSALTGSTTEGAAAFEDLQKFAATTPFELSQVTTAARSLIAAGKDTGELPKSLTELGNVAAATGAPLEEVALIFQQMYTKGKISNEELLQLAERGVPAYTALADALGVSVEELTEMASKGELGAEQIDLLSQSLGDLYPTAMVDLAASFNGQLSTMNDNLTQIGGNLGQVVLPVMSELLGTFNNMLGPMASITKAFQDLPGPIKDAAGQLIVISSVVTSAAFFGPLVMSALGAVKTGLSNVGGGAVLAAGKLKTVGAALQISATLIALDLLDKGLEKIFDQEFTGSDINRELEYLAYNGEAVGEMAGTFGENLASLGQNLRTVDSDAAKVSNTLFGWVPFDDTSFKTATDNIEQLDQGLAAMAESGNPELAAQAFDVIIAKAKEAGVPIEDVEKHFDDYMLVVGNAASATEDQASASEEAAAAAERHAAVMERLNTEVAETTERYAEMRDAFTVANQGMIDARTAVYDYEGALDALREGFKKGITFEPDLEQGRTNFANLVAVADAGAEKVEQTWIQHGRAAAMKVYREQRQSLARILIDAGVEAGQAWRLVNQVFKKPVNIRAELQELDIAKWERQLARLRQRRAEEFPAKFKFPSGKEVGVQGAEAMRRMRTQVEEAEPINARIRAVTEKIKDAQKDLNNTANPNGKGRNAKIKPVVDPSSKRAAKADLRELSQDLDVYIRTHVVSPSGGTGGGGGGAGGGGGGGGPGLLAAPMLATAGATMMAAPTPSAVMSMGGGGALNLRMAGGEAPAPPVERLRPQQTPVVVHNYLDGREIGNRVQATRVTGPSRQRRRA